MQPFFPNIGGALRWTKVLFVEGGVESASTSLRPLNALATFRLSLDPEAPNAREIVFGVDGGQAIAGDRMLAGDTAARPSAARPPHLSP